MKTNVFAVYDSKAEMYQGPVFVPAVGAAIRAFADAVNDPKTELSKHPGDYVLYQIAMFNDASGTFENLEPAKHLGIGSDYVRMERRFENADYLTKPVEVANGKEG